MVRIGRWAAKVLAAGVTMVAVVAATAGPAHAAGSFSCRYVVNAFWMTGYSSDLWITNNGPAISAWTAHWTFHDPAQLTGAWNATMWQDTPRDMSGRSVSFNTQVPTGGTVAFGWTALAPVAEIPTDITVNGVAC